MSNFFPSHNSAVFTYHVGLSAFLISLVLNLSGSIYIAICKASCKPSGHQSFARSCQQREGKVFWVASFPHYENYNTHFLCWNYAKPLENMGCCSSMLQSTLSCLGGFMSYVGMGYAILACVFFSNQFSCLQLLLPMLMVSAITARSEHPIFCPGTKSVMIQSMRKKLYLWWFSAYFLGVLIAAQLVLHLGIVVHQLPFTRYSGIDVWSFFSAHQPPSPSPC